jgi:hypothetical protein
MLDYAITLAPELHEAMRQARTYEAEQRTWLRRLRDIERAERRERSARGIAVVAQAPRNSATVYKMWI